MRRFMGRGAAMVAALMMIGAVFAFAGGQQEPATETTEGGAVKIEFWHSWAPESLAGRVLQGLIDEYNAQNDGETFVMPVYMAGKRSEKIAGALAAGDPPDMAWISNFGAAYYEADQLIDMDRVYDEYIERDDLIASLVDRQQYLGEDISLPFENSSLALLYDRRKLQEAGIEEPSTDMDASWTWDDFISAAAQFSNPEEGQYGWEPRINTAVLNSLFWQNGGQYLSEDKRSNLIVEDPEMRARMVEALEVIHRMVWDERITANDIGDQGFGTQDTVFEITGPWDVASNMAPEGAYEAERFGVAPMPRLADGEYYSRWYQKSLAVFQTNEARENATLEFLSWFYSPEIQARWSVEAGYLPITESAQETEIWQSHLEDFPQYQVFVEQSENLGIREKGVPHGDIGTMLDAVRFDEATPEEAVATYIETAQQQLDQFWARRSN